jgi:hypothetical protein
VLCGGDDDEVHVMCFCMASKLTICHCSQVDLGGIRNK